VSLVPRCPNCDGLLPGPKLFCGEQCQQAAGLVRWWREIRTNGKIDDVEIQDLLHMRLVKTVKGGYPRKERHLDPVQRYQIFERDRGLCVECGQPGKEIDHIDGSSADPSNLQLLCRDCHKDKTYRNLDTIDTDEEREYAMYMEWRAKAATPVRVCDDPVIWPVIWRDRLAKVRAFMKGAAWDG
jgi:5-methylcytosine-specific restriction endonuclease McrA